MAVATPGPICPGPDPTSHFTIEGAAALVDLAIQQEAGIGMSRASFR
jgi:hypothetical protein